MDAIRRRLGYYSPQGSAQDAHDGFSEEVEASGSNTQAGQASSGPDLSGMLPTATSSSPGPAMSTLASSKLLSLWHSMKYGKTLFALEAGAATGVAEAPLYLLGRSYQRRRLIDASGQSRMTYSLDRAQNWIETSSDEDHEDAVVQAFQIDFYSRVWMTYRREFEHFRGTSVNTDCGWGCMIRSGQMMLSNALVLQKLGRSWRYRTADKQVMTSDDLYESAVHHSIIRLFGDSSDAKTSPLSIHKLMGIAKSLWSRQPGDWFGPGSTAHLLKMAVKDSDHPMLQDICIYVAQDCTTYQQDVRDLCRETARQRAARRRELEEEQRKSRNSMRSNASRPDDTFSVLEHPSEYTDLIALPSRESFDRQSRLFSGVVDGVPYFEEGREIKEEADESLPVMLSDEAQFFSLNETVRINGQEWVAEGPARPTVTQAQADSPAPRPPSDSRVQPPPQSNPVSLSSEWTPVLILIPVRLGMEKLNPIYISSIKAMLATDECVGIMGGRPKHSLYFVGFQEENLIHLDPHLVQDNVNVFQEQFPLDSFHCKSPRKMNIHRMDPSCCLGFLINDENSFEKWCQDMKRITRPLGGSVTDYPMFTIVNEKSTSVQMSRSLIESDSTDAAVAATAEREDPRNTEFSSDFVFI